MSIVERIARLLIPGHYARRDAVERRLYEWPGSDDTRTIPLASAREKNRRAVLQAALREYAADR